MNERDIIRALQANAEELLSRQVDGSYGSNLCEQLVDLLVEIKSAHEWIPDGA